MSETVTTTETVKSPKVKLTAEQRAEKLAAMSPEERAAYDKKLESLAKARLIKSQINSGIESNNEDENAELKKVRQRYY